MIRKLALLFLLSICLHSVVKAQSTDAVTITIAPYTDTTCPGTQLFFTARQSVDTFSTTSYNWFINGVFTGITIDTFVTTAPVDGDNIYCEIFYTNSLGTIASAVSNSITIHRSTSIPPGVIVALTTGSNPYCTPILNTFTAFTINGGTSPSYQWMINGLSILGEDSSTISRVFAFGDIVSVRAVSNSTCSGIYNDTVFSGTVPIVHDSLTAGIIIAATGNPICAGGADTFTATITSPGGGSSLAWYVDSTLVVSALGPTFTTNSLVNGDLVYALLTAPDPCIINHTTISNVITMTVIPLLPTSVETTLTAGSNPGCLDSPVTFTATFHNFGTAPVYTWLINEVPVSAGSPTLTSTFADGDTVSFRIYETDEGCYTHDTILTPPFLLIRDSTPVAPLVSLIGDLLVTNSGGSFIWFYDSTIIPGVIGQVYHPTGLGHYYAEKDTGNCPSLGSNLIYISLLGVNNMNNGANVSIYPNPTAGMLNIDWGKQTAHMGVDVYNIVGQGLLHLDANGQSHLETDISYLPEGNYFVVLKDEDGTKTTYKVTLSK